MSTVHHLAFAHDWDDACAAGEYDWSTRGLRIADVGYLHGCFPHQVDGVLARFYSDCPEPLVLLTLDIDALSRLRRWIVVEPAVPGDPHAELFPHLYGGTLPTGCVTTVVPYPPAATTPPAGR